MKKAVTLQELDQALEDYRNSGKTIGFVPTMGALHDGHLSLVNLAKEKADIVVVSIFVNPTQFAPHEDYDAYPRDVNGDIEKLKPLDVDVVFCPTKDDLYPDGTDSAVKAGSNAEGLETIFRPHFFDGVVNVVSRLFDAVKPDVAVFGEKDFQQLMVIREMVETLGLDIEIIGGEIVRDEHGLALSSRNAYLSTEELEIARQLNKIIRNAAKTKDLDTAKAELLKTGFDKVDYVEKRWNRILAAAWLGKTRLIDNIPVISTER
ncbi:MAG: pantoate--beta-alanine ligase [Alphaproteobacteria bacterium]|nr:pantoate--beta-alanine ligase [Alphaproteobacteria bacterium]